MTRDLDELTAYPARLDPIYETVAQGEGRAAAGKTLIGFAGSPWTVATYMVAGQGSRDQAEARRLAYADPAKFGAIIERIEAVTLDYLSRPGRGRRRGAAIVRQLGGKPVAGAVRAMGDRADRAARRPRCKQRHPDVPVIGFPKGAGGKLAAYARETGVDAIGLDETVDPVWAAQGAARKTCRCRAISTRSR